MVLRGVKPFPGLRKGCVLRKSNFMWVGVSLNLIQFVYLALRKNKSVSKCAVKRSRCRHPSRVLHLFPTECKIRLRLFFFKFAATGRNLRKVRFTQVEYYASLGVTVFGPLRGRKWQENIESCRGRRFMICAIHQVLYGWLNQRLGLYDGISKIFQTDAVKIIKIINKRVWKLPTSTLLHATWYTDSQDMVVLPSTGASCYHNCCIDGSTNPECFGYHLVACMGRI
jgi:hypothetical protein